MRNGPRNEFGLNGVAQRRENSMAGLNNHQRAMIERLRARYPRTDIQLQKGLLQAAICSYYDDNPAKGPDGRNLPLDIDGSVGFGDARLLHAGHTAYRYLFMVPNPWMSPNAGHIDIARRAPIIKQDQWEGLALIWQLLNDDTAELFEGYSLDDMRKTFIETLKLIGRAHNHDHGADDNDLDKPSCSMGVTQRLLNGLVGFAMAEDPAQRNLNFDLLAQKFKEEYVTNDNKGLKPIIDNMSNEDLRTLNDAIENHVLMATPIEGLQEDQKNVAQRLAFSAQQQRDFCETCNAFWTAERVAGYRNFKYQGRNQADVPSFINYMATKPFDCFGQFLYEYVGNKVNALPDADAPQPQADPQPEEGNVPQNNNGPAVADPLAEPNGDDAQDDDIFAQIDIAEQIRLMQMFEEQRRAQEDRLRRDQEQARRQQQQEQARREEEARQARLREQAQRQQQEQARRDEEARQARLREQARRDEEARQARNRADMIRRQEQERQRLVRERQARVQQHPQMEHHENAVVDQAQDVGNGVRRFNGLLI